MGGSRTAPSQVQVVKVKVLFWRYLHTACRPDARSCCLKRRVVCRGEGVVSQKKGVPRVISPRDTRAIPLERPQVSIIHPF